MAKRKSMDYSQLKESTHKRLASFLEKTHKSGVSFTQLRKMNDNDFAQTLGIKKGKRIKGNKFSNIESNRRLLNQSQKSKERREGSIDLAKESYIKFGYTGKGLERIEKELIKASGNIFSAISAQIEQTYFAKIKDVKRRMRRSDLYTKKLLLINKEDRKKLQKIDQDILSDFSP